MLPSTLLSFYKPVQCNVAWNVFKLLPDQEGPRVTVDGPLARRPGRLPQASNIRPGRRALARPLLLSSTLIDLSHPPQYLLISLLHPCPPGQLLRRHTLWHHARANSRSLRRGLLADLHRTSWLRTSLPSRHELPNQAPQKRRAHTRQKLEWLGATRAHVR